MKSYSLSLKIADLVIVLRTRSFLEHNFLSNKYYEYITNNSKRRPAAVIFCGFTGSIKNVPHFIFTESVVERFGLFSEYFRKILMGVLNSSGGMLLHASSVVIAEKGFVFMGDEGAGKSTIRTLLSQYMSLGDDTAIIRKRGNKIYLYGSPLYQRTKMAYPNKKVLVAGIFSLVQAPFNLIQTLDLPSQLRQLSNNVWLSGLDGFQNEKQALARTLLSFSNFQRVFTLYFKKTPEIGTLLLAFSQHSWHAKIPRRIFSKANIDLRRSLEKDALWSEGIADGSFLEQCLVINERSWDFEFGQERNFLEIAKKILASPEDAYHRSFVHSKKKLLRQGKEKPVVIVIKHGDSHVILDGNHSALAWHSMGDRAKQAGITVFVGTIIPEKENETILKSYL